MILSKFWRLTVLLLPQQQHNLEDKNRPQWRITASNIDKSNLDINNIGAAKAIIIIIIIIKMEFENKH